MGSAPIPSVISAGAEDEEQNVGDAHSWSKAITSSREMADIVSA